MISSGLRNCIHHLNIYKKVIWGAHTVLDCKLKWIKWQMAPSSQVLWEVDKELVVELVMGVVLDKAVDEEVDE